MLLPPPELLLHVIDRAVKTKTILARVTKNQSILDRASLQVPGGSKRYKNVPFISTESLKSKEGIEALNGLLKELFTKEEVVDGYGKVDTLFQVHAQHLSDYYIRG